MKILIYVILLGLLVTIPDLSKAEAPKKPKSAVTEGVRRKGVKKVALLSFPELFCRFTERSKPHAYIGFALQIDGRVKFFKTKTKCKDFDLTVRQPVIFGEYIVLYGGSTPTAIKRENGEYYKIEPLNAIRMFFHPDVVLSIWDNPDFEKNPHPEMIMEECRSLVDQKERDFCLWHQAGSQRNLTICNELSEAKQESCKAWIYNIENGKINR